MVVSVGCSLTDGAGNNSAVRRSVRCNPANATVTVIQHSAAARANVPNEHRCKKNGGFLDAVCGVSACIFCKIACFIRSFAASSGLRLSQMAFQSCCISVTSDLFLECFSASLEERTHCGFFFLHHFCNFLAGILFIIIEI